MTGKDLPLEGRCKCGAVHYRVLAAPTYVGNCHCDDCRRATGGASVPWIGARPEDFEVVRGDIREFESSPGILRGFCGTCGSSLTFRGEGWDEVGITIASLDNPNAITPQSNVFLKEKLHWLLINEDMRNYDGFPS
ncbi:GFA family protein [Shimia sediminis]|uniref:GFA family protein n=1 Tax=Shimia sediminis TaxID=2497945 RepID=UPI000F8CC18B|nr:GFA family protein [Shimia sediminis]